MASQEREQALAKTAIALMGDCSVPPTPDNFELFYLYASGDNAAISNALGELVRKRSPISTSLLNDLRARCLTSERAAKTVEEVGSGISEALDVVLGKLEAAGKHAGDYGRALSAASGELGDDQSPDGVRKLVDGLLGATRAMETRAKNLEDELQRSSQQVTELKVQLEDVRKETRVDALTGIANRKAFDSELQAAVNDFRETGVPVSLLMCDIDFFKSFNDTWGHQTGDQVLRLVATCLSENVKGRDTAARYGGEEFTVILRQTALADAINLANQIRSTVEGKKLVKKSTGDILGRITISIGVAELRRGDAPELLVRRADTCLYRAKHTGRNRVVGETELAVQEETDAA
ncbi:MAG: diguanylate cyclase [Alphaproteobacteria bacterium]|nr:diguanylate cyclase [Alphaproteobacteria bacterium]MDE1985815.1 diguanylate cyclase [Alphaproteobacteria bacterium]MDE2163666.1 diguanylate cyclase [Alphaproteobacteria bacterium]MDE2264355.1 diguanylate cyclase [Alphaproteobacteria bacterium]MDE2500798.1 diguanylate cyclase [Alphaproteobacteria bacterium]